MKPIEQIEVGDELLIPIYSKGKRLMSTEHAKVINLFSKRSGEKMVLVQRPITLIKMVFPVSQLQNFWQDYSTYMPIRKKGK
jgi:hypothetical protein